MDALKSLTDYFLSASRSAYKGMVDQSSKRMYMTLWY